MDLEGLDILVTGGGRGIGREIARGLDARGARPILVGRDGAALEETAALLRGRCGIRAADLADRDAVDDLIEWCRRDRPDIAGLVNNAAVQHEMRLVQGDAEAHAARAREEIALDLEAPMVLSMGLLPLLRSRDRALLCNVTSGVAFAPKEAAPGYCAAKAGLHAFTQALRYQCARDAPRILVNEAILPMVDTAMTAGRGRGKIPARDAAEAILRGIEAGRAESWIGKARVLRVLRRVAPGLPERLLRGGRA
ncbi:SDR family NAD(P)-dependent oxidoreductase [Jannaschia formosa]|uniref:SDR family NAD(P)-dependent oxidoreductase n=1 Tax=Jannaschia formosa TaxID=2259592 RepID=UPI000E1BAAD5|nr:SDR family NAD(P)-dependent oxidoreductase [Jannaschia formosa]TFL19325.1 SDR family NAD(P)-dependent oxidoreductase [Jannaschia formosa]